MIRPNNPAIDVEALEQRVRETMISEADDRAARASRANDAAVRAARDREEVTFLLELVTVVEGRLDLARERYAPRTALPPRLARFGPLGPAIVRAFNYLFKTQREVDRELMASCRALAHAVRLLAERSTSVDQR